MVFDQQVFPKMYTLRIAWPVHEKREPSKLPIGQQVSAWINDFQNMSFATLELPKGFPKVVQINLSNYAYDVLAPI
jgi:hypothetical protein